MEFTTLFPSHGLPMMVLEDTPTRRFLMELGRTTPKPPAIIAVSAHWQTSQPVLGFAAWPDKINDIHGFPAELYRLDYAPPGAPVAPLSVQPQAGAAHHYFLGRRLAPLVAEGVLAMDAFGFR